MDWMVRVVTYVIPDQLQWLATLLAHLSPIPSDLGIDEFNRSECLVSRHRM